MLSVIRQMAKSIFSVPQEVSERFSQLNIPELHYGVDPLGLDPDYLRAVIGPVYFLYKHYFRVQTYNIDNIPDGGCLLVSNHSGQLPWDALMISAAVFLEGEPARVVRSTVEKFVSHVPFLSYWYPRLGQITGTPENAKRLLQLEQTLLVFPEGVRGISKTWNQRYQLQDFGTGFLRLAIETKTPIVPVGVVGAEEQSPSFYNAKKIGSLLGMPAFPITPTNPWLPVVGLAPYPVKYHIGFGTPLVFEGDPDAEDETIKPYVNTVKEQISTILVTLRNRRTSIF